MSNILIYAKNLEQIGSRIEDISNSINLGKRDKITTKPQLISYAEGLIEAIKQYGICKLDLIKIKPPVILNEEHNNLIQSFDGFIKGTRMMFDSVDVENFKTDEELFKKGIIKQNESKKQVMNITNQIVVKIASIQS